MTMNIHTTSDAQRAAVKQSVAYRRARGGHVLHQRVLVGQEDIVVALLVGVHLVLATAVHLAVTAGGALLGL